MYVLYTEDVSNFCVYGWNLKAWPFKWKLLSVLLFFFPAFVWSGIFLPISGPIQQVGLCSVYIVCLDQFVCVRTFNTYPSREFPERQNWHPDILACEYTLSASRAYYPVGVSLLASGKLKSFFTAPCYWTSRGDNFSVINHHLCLVTGYFASKTAMF